MSFSLPTGFALNAVRASSARPPLAVQVLPPETTTAVDKSEAMTIFLNNGLVINESEWRHFIGDRAEYYLSRWRDIEKSRQKANWNWAAFFFHGWWLAYRKMYYQAFIVLSIAMMDIIFRTSLGMHDFGSRSIKYIFLIPVGLFANYLYYTHARQKIVEIKILHKTEESQAAAFPQSGGTSWVGCMIAILAFVLLLIVPLIF